MSEFKREERYIVVKLKHLAGLQVAPLRNFLRENRVPTLDCVVVEADWPEYEKVWRSIERRMTGQPAEDFDRVTAERDALQQRLTAADDQLDDCGQFQQRQIAVIQERNTRVEVLEGLLRKAQPFTWGLKGEVEGLWLAIFDSLKTAPTLSDFPQRQEPGSGSVSRNTFHNTGGTYGADLIGMSLTEITVTSGFKCNYTEENLKSGGFVDNTPGAEEVGHEQ